MKKWLKEIDDLNNDYSYNSLNKYIKENKEKEKVKEKTKHKDEDEDVGYKNHLNSEHEIPEVNVLPPAVKPIVIPVIDQKPYKNKLKPSKDLKNHHIKVKKLIAKSKK